MLLREVIAERIEFLIEVLDLLDGDPDFELDADLELEPDLEPEEGV